MILEYYNTGVCRNLWVRLHVPVRSRVRSSTFQQSRYEQCQSVTILMGTRLYATPRSNTCFMGEEKRKKTKSLADLMLLYTFTCKMIKNELHVSARSLWGKKSMIVSKQVHVPARSLWGLKTEKIPKTNKQPTP